MLLYAISWYAGEYDGEDSCSNKDKESTPNTSSEHQLSYKRMFDLHQSVAAT